MEYFNNDKLNERFPLPAPEPPAGDDGAADNPDPLDNPDPDKIPQDKVGEQNPDKVPQDKAPEDKAAAENPDKVPQDKVPEENPDKVPLEKAPAQNQAPLSAEQKDELLQAYLAEQGLGTLEELKALKTKSAENPETEAQRQQRLEDYNNQVTAFGLSQQLLTKTDIQELENVSLLDDRSLARKEFADEYRQANKDRLDEHGHKDPVTEEEIEDSFEEFYHLYSDAPALKARGEKMIQQMATQLRSAAQGKFEAAKAGFEAKAHKDAHVPLFSKFLQESLQKAIPESLTIFQEGDQQVKFTLKDDTGKLKYNLAELEKLFVNDAVYEQFLASDDKSGLEKYISQTVLSQLHETNKGEMAKLIYEQGRNAGRKEGSSVGAKAPFKSAQGVPPVPTTDKVMTDADKSNLKSQFQRR